MRLLGATGRLAMSASYDNFGKYNLTHQIGEGVE
jgi:hypothetical protein